jgi:DNA-binding transcriptional LysR family regulator
LRLTAEGELVLRHVGATLYEFDRLRAELDQLHGVPSGVVRIVSLDSLFVHLLPRVIVSFHRAHPAVRYVVEAADPHLIAARVAEGEADVGIGFDLERHGEVELAAAIASPLCAMVAPRHPLAGQTCTNFVECARYPLLFQPDTRPTRSIMDAELAAAKSSSEAFLVANTLVLLKHMVRAGLGVAFYTRIGFIDELRAGSVIAVPLAETRLAEIRVGLMLPRRRRPTPAVAAMIEHLSEALHDLAPELSNP